MRLLIEVNQRQRVFVSTVSHEFRTSLTSILGFSELLRDENLDLMESKDYANDIYEESLRLHRMIDDVLDLEKMQEDKLTLRKEQVDCNILLRETVERMQVSSAHHLLRCQLDESIPLLEADRDKLIQVMTNLLSNAIKYSPDGGEIVVSSRKDGDMLHVSVQDSGIGIPVEALEQIFIPYHRGDVETVHHIRGTGLGLPIVHQIVTLHGGSVWVESVVKQGSTFHFTLPLTPVAALREEKAITR
jgi:signal transduction histidine kinase